MAFSDLKCQEDAIFTVEPVAQRFEPKSQKARKLYRLTAEDPLPEEEEDLVLLDNHQLLTGEIRLEGLPADLAGTLLLAMGADEGGVIPLRIGGGKNRGLGAMETAVLTDSEWAPDRGSWLRGERSALEADVIRQWIKAAHRSFPEMAKRIETIVHTMHQNHEKDR